MMEELKFLPPALYFALCKLDYSKLYEVRIRADKPVKICYDGRFINLSRHVDESEKHGLGSAAGTSFMAKHNIYAEFVRLSATQINEIVLRAAEFSIYAFNSQLASGYITISGGIRIGVAGEVVYEGEKVKTQKNFGSLVIRIPHEIKGCADIAYRSLTSSTNKNMLLISPPGCGKTTILRDITRRISDAGANVLLVDERSEIAACRGGVATLDVGQNTDVISCGGKNYAFSFGVRSLRPDYIVTDELMCANDIEAVARAALSGVNVIASLHASGIDDIKNRLEFAAVLTSRIFGRYVFLSQKNGAGTYERILGESFDAVL